MKKMKKVKSHSKTKTKVLSGKADKVDREVEMEKDNLFSIGPMISFKNMTPAKRIIFLALAQ